MIGSDNEPTSPRPLPQVDVAKGPIPLGGPTTGRDVIVRDVRGLAQLPYSCHYLVYDMQVVLSSSAARLHPLRRGEGGGGDERGDEGDEAEEHGL